MTKIGCADVKDLLPEWIRRELEEGDRAVVTAHVSSCASCSEEVELLERIRGAAFSTPASLASEIKSAVAAEMESDAGFEYSQVQARFDNLVREELELSEDQTRQLQEVVEAFRSRRLEFSQSERNTRARVGRLGAPGGGQELTEQEASEILAEMLELSGAEATLFREEQEALLRILSAPQVVRFIVMRQQLGDRIRSLRGGGGPGRGRQGGRGPGQLRPGR